MLHLGRRGRDARQRQQLAFIKKRYLGRLSAEKRIVSDPGPRKSNIPSTGMERQGSARRLTGSHARVCSREYSWTFLPHSRALCSSIQITSYSIPWPTIILSFQGCIGTLPLCCGPQDLWDLTNVFAAVRSTCRRPSGSQPVLRAP